MAGVVERNLEALLACRHAASARMGLQERLAARISAFAGSVRFVHVHLARFGLWIAINLGWLGLPRFDRSFTVLAMAAMADKRADLDLQVSLLAEHEVTRLIRLVTRIAERLDIDEARDPRLDELAQDVAPERVLDQIEASERRKAI